MDRKSRENGPLNRSTESIWTNLSWSTTGMDTLRATRPSNLSTLSGQLKKYDQILVQEYVHFEQVNVLTDDLCCAKNVVLCSAGEKQMSLNLLISCGGVIATLSIARSATGRMLVKSVWGWIKQLFQKPHETGSSHSEGVVEIRVYGKTRPSRIAPSMRVVSF